MEETKLTFERYEKKYLLDAGLYERLWQRLEPYLEPDLYPRSTVCSLYYDSADYRLIRHSIEAPVYKEKLRLRSYGVPGDGDTVFVELKKKYDGIVYKRRVGMPAAQAALWLAGGCAVEDSQTAREIEYFLQNYRPEPRVYLACERTAWRAKENAELRITFDRDIRWRQDALDLRAGSGGEPLLEDGRLLMEIKLPGAAPLWLAHLLSEFSVFPASFSKYGTCYREHILPDYIKGVVFSA